MSPDSVARRRIDLWRLALGVSALGAALLALFKRGWLPADPTLLAVVAGLAWLLAAGELARIALAVARRRLRWTAVVHRALICLGLLASIGAGMGNWLFGLQGAVILSELETLTLSSTAQLQEFSGGPLSRVDEMGMALQLEKLALRPGGGGTFSPVSRLRVLRAGKAVTVVEVDPGTAAEVGTLRFLQGAFGFAPRIVVLRDGRSVFDRVVPFTSERQGAHGIAFLGEFNLRQEGLAIQGSVNLDGLDEQMRGHPRLELAVRKAGRSLGSGELRPGEFAELAEGYRIGFAGLNKWSEIDIARRNYPQPILGGLATTVLGLLLWPLVAWRRW